MGACPESLNFQRHRTGAFIVYVTHGAKIVVVDEDPEYPTWICVTQYKRWHCFTQSEALGLQRYPDGDSNHFEAETKTAYIIGRIVAPTSTETLKCTAAECFSSALGVSKDNDVPMMLLIYVFAGSIVITQTIGEKFISNEKIDSVLRILGVQKEHICSAFEMGVRSYRRGRKE